MKRILIVCLLGMGLLLPATNLTAKEFSKKEVFKKRIVDCFLEGDILIVTSDANTGTLSNVKIWSGGKQLVLQQSVSGYEDEVDLSSLPSGYYSAQVFTSLTVYSENFYLN